MNDYRPQEQQQHEARMLTIHQLSLAAGFCANAAMFATAFERNGGCDLDSKLYAINEIEKAQKALGLARSEIDNGDSDDATYGGQPSEHAFVCRITRPEGVVTGGTD